MFSLIGICSADLSSDYYEKSCPKAMYTIKNAVANAVTNERRMGASLLRLHFHDCFVNARSLLNTFIFVSHATDINCVNSLILTFIFVSHTTDVYSDTSCFYF